MGGWELIPFAIYDYIQPDVIRNQNVLRKKVHFSTLVNVKSKGHDNATTKWTEGGSDVVPKDDFTWVDTSFGPSQ